MNTDVAFSIGKSHNICEDYSVSLSNDRIILCDGCSSSKMTDVGARLLALYTDKILEDNYYESLDEDFYDDLCTILKSKFDELLSDDKTMLDATLLISRQKDNWIDIFVMGDGVIYIEYKDGHNRAYNISYPLGYPQYLSYDFDEQRKINFILLNSYREISIDDHIQILREDVAKDNYFDLQLDIENIKFVTLFSDGVHSFTDENRKEISYTEVIKQMTSYKTFTGQFVQRRMNAFKQFCEKNKWSHYDDISMATLYVGE